MLNTFLKIVIALVLLSLGYFVYMGATHREGTIQTDVVIDAPAEEVYRYLGDPSLAPLWIPGLISIEQTSGQGLSVGATYKLIFESGKNQIVMTETVTDVEPFQRLDFQLESDFVNSDIAIELTPEGRSTRVTETNNYRGNNFLARAMTGLTKRATAQHQKSMYDSLKDAVESDAAATAP